MIICIEGPAKSGKSIIATALRNSQISQRQGALLIDDKADVSELNHHIEKIIDGEPLVPGTEASKIKWKKSPLVVLVGSERSTKLLAEIEKLVPGFSKVMGPVTKLTTSFGSAPKDGLEKQSISQKDVGKLDVGAVTGDKK